MFLRPRGFGKTLFTEILRHYCDSALSPVSDELFRGTWIHSHPSALKGRYLVLQFDFSGLSGFGTLEDIVDAFRQRLISGIGGFYQIHPEFLPPASGGAAGDRMSLDDVLNQEEFSSPVMIISRFLSDLDCMMDASMIMVIIDEYDFFTRDCLRCDPDKLSSLIYGKGDIATFYSLLRNYNQHGTVNRILLTGTHPFNLGTGISGFVCTGISDTPALNSLAGFTRDEALELLREAVDLRQSPFAPDEVLRHMEEWCGGYRFSQSCQDTVFSPVQCMNFIRAFADCGCQRIPGPEDFLEGGADYAALAGVLDLLSTEDRSAVGHAAVEGRILPEPLSSPARVLAGDEVMSRRAGVSLLFYLGLLTLASVKESSEGGMYPGRKFLKVPNGYVRRLFARYLGTLS